jgi:hypothetical protein
MPMPAGATFQGEDGVWYAYDEQTGGYVPAVSTPEAAAQTWPAPIRQIFDKNAPGFTGMAESIRKPGESIFDAALRALPNIAAAKGQVDLINVNISRAKQGLPPIDLAPYTGFGVNVGLDPATQKLVTYAGLGILALFLLNIATKK